MATQNAKRRYSDEERANAIAALAANGGNVERTARDLGIPRKTLANWARGKHHAEAAKNGQEKKGPLADAFETIARRCLGHLSDEKLNSAGAVDLVKTAAIAVDKMRLLRDEPTEITKNSVTPEQGQKSRDRVTELIGAARKRQLAGAPLTIVPLPSDNGQSQVEGAA